MFIPKPLIERFLNAYIPVTESGCWLWTGSCNNYGYGKILNRNKSLAAHRLAYELFIGPIPKGLVIDHLCRVPCCVNPDHLEPVTNRENILRGIGRTAINSKKSRCVNGHPFDEPNTTMRRHGGRECHTCRLISKRKLCAKMASLRKGK